MRRRRIAPVLHRECGLHLSALTWLPDSTLLEVVPSAANEAEALATIAEQLFVDLVFVDAARPWASEAVVLLHERDIAAGWIVAGPLSRATEKLGWHEALKLSVADPRRLTNIFEQLLQEALSLVMLGRGRQAEVMMVADDVAGASGWLVSPDFAMDSLVPCYRQLAFEWQRPGAAAVFHSDGDTRALMPKLAASGFQGVHLGSQGDLLQAGLWSARAAGLVPLGGIEARALAIDRDEAAEVAVAMVQTGPAIVADDGGLTTSRDVECFSAALRLMREALKPDI